MSTVEHIRRRFYSNLDALHDDLLLHELTNMYHLYTGMSERYGEMAKIIAKDMADMKKRMKIEEPVEGEKEEMPDLQLEDSATRSLADVLGGQTFFSEPRPRSFFEIVNKD